mmetsp:Transcript_3034/g.7123  ORF Transcript_3034/g.7123 Transcript_3034/m.7123 type:complete len:434 (-) Transcript_3034:295-1596(-)
MPSSSVSINRSNALEQGVDTREPVQLRLLRAQVRRPDLSVTEKAAYADGLRKRRLEGLAVHVGPPIAPGASAAAAEEQPSPHHALGEGSPAVDNPIAKARLGAHELLRPAQLLVDTSFHVARVAVRHQLQGGADLRDVLLPIQIQQQASIVHQNPPVQAEFARIGLRPGCYAAEYLALFIKVDLLGHHAHRVPCRDLIADSLTGVVLRAHHLDDRTLHRRDSESRADGAEAARHRGVGERRRLFALCRHGLVRRDHGNDGAGAAQRDKALALCGRRLAAHLRHRCAVLAALISPQHPRRPAAVEARCNAARDFAVREALVEGLDEPAHAEVVRARLGVGKHDEVDAPPRVLDLVFDSRYHVCQVLVVGDAEGVDVAGGHVCERQRDRDHRTRHPVFVILRGLGLHRLLLVLIIPNDAGTSTSSQVQRWQLSDL